jgi:hypothetical protein
MANATSNIQSKLSSAINPEAQKEALKLMDDASETANKFYDRSSEWLSQNRSWVLNGASIVAAGVIGFFIGKSFSGSSKSPAEEKEDLF